MIERVYNLTESDAEAITALGNDFYKLLGIEGSFHVNTFITFWNAFMGKGIASMWIARVEEKIVGAIGFTLTMSIFDGATVAEEMFWFVDKGHRGSAGARLFMEAQKWAKNSGAKRIMMGRIIAADADNQIGKFYERSGFKPLQTQYILDL